MSHESHNQLAPRLLMELIKGSDMNEVESLIVIESMLLGVVQFFRPGDIRAQTVFLETISERVIERLA